MSTERVVTDNELIIPISEFNLIFDFMPEFNRPTGGGHTTTIDWNTLIPVLQKIKNLLLAEGEFDNSIAYSKWKPIINELQNLNLKNTHFCAVKWMKWYYSQPSPIKENSPETIK